MNAIAEISLRNESLFDMPFLRLSLLEKQLIVNLPKAIKEKPLETVFSVLYN